MIFGYMRISTMKDKQTTDRQELTLKNYAKQHNFEFEDIVKERVSGTVKTDNREKYSALKKNLRPGDILVLTDLDRLGRSADNVIMEIKELKEKQIKVIALDIPYMSDWNKVNDDAMYDMIIDILVTLKAHIAQQERIKIQERINQGLAVAREKGKTLGRPKTELTKEFLKEYKKYKNGEYGKISAVQFAKLLNISRATLYKYIALAERNIKCKN